MDERFLSLLSSIRAKQSHLRSSAISMRREKPDLVRKVHQSKSPALSLSVCAVDGGLVSQRMHGSDIVITRAVGVHFVYDGSRLVSFDHFPSKSVEPVIEFKNALDEHEANVFKSLIRLKHELSCAISILEKYSPDLLLLDGSLWLVPSDRPQSGSELAPLYQEVVSLFKKLYSLCGVKRGDKAQTRLCGVIKDSRSRKLARDLGLDCSDTVLCRYMLEAGERTAVMPYFDDEQKEPDGFAKRLKVLYLKPSEQDLPLRVEFLGDDGHQVDAGKTPGSEEDSVASLIHSLSSISESFAYPAILVEADMCAAMDSREIEHIQNQLSSLDIQPLRRNSRPFR